MVRQAAWPELWI